MITGVHTILYSTDADATRAFFRDTLGLQSVDAGRGWLIFALPPGELAAHPSDSGDECEMYLMCDDIKKTVAELKKKGVEFIEPITEQGWGALTRLRVPGGIELGIYEPHHPTAIKLK